MGEEYDESDISYDLHLMEHDYDYNSQIPLCSTMFGDAYYFS